MNTILKSIAMLLILIITFVAIFLNNLPLDLLSFSSAPFFGTIIMLIIILSLNRNFEDESFSNKFDWLLIVPFSLFSIFIVMWVASWSVIGNAEEYKALLTEPEKAEFSDVIGTVNFNEAPIVSEKQAKEKAKTLISHYGSQYSLGTFNQISYKKSLYWVAPLEYSGFWRWALTETGIPGYVLISSSNISDANLVTKNNKGDDLSLTYMESAWFMDNISNNVYFRGTMLDGLTDYSFELDEDGNPYYVVTRYSRKVGSSGSYVKGIFTVDVRSGEMKEFITKIGDDSNIPEWIDNVYPIGLIEDHINYYGVFIDGSFNWANDGKIKASKGSKTIVGKDGRLYLYTGLQSIGSDTGTVGFMFVDLRTKKVLQISLQGSTEAKAQETVEANPVNIKNYQADFPIPVVVNGVNSYMMTLQSIQGLPKMFGFSSIENHEISGVGKTLREAQNAYESKLASGYRLNMDLSESSDVSKATGKVLRINSQYTPSGTQYFILVEGYENFIFTTKSENSQEVVLTKEGDGIEFSFIQRESKIINILNLDNLNF